VDRDSTVLQVTGKRDAQLERVVHRHAEGARRERGARLVLEPLHEPKEPRLRLVAPKAPAGLEVQAAGRGLALDVVERRDRGQRRCGAELFRVESFEELPADVGPAGHFYKASPPEELVVAGVGIRLEVSGAITEESFRTVSSSRGGVVEDHRTAL